MLDNQQEIEALDRLFRQAHRYRLAYESALNEALDEFNSHDSPVLLEAHQLLLQLRLDTQDLIKQLLAFNQSLCQALGMEPQSSEIHNLEQAAFVLGKDNLKNALAFLISLTKQLRHALSQSEYALLEQEKEQKKLKELIRSLSQAARTKALNTVLEDCDVDEVTNTIRARKKGLNHKLATALDYQSNFQWSIAQLTESLQTYACLPKFGSIYTFLATLQGPISRYYQATQNGLVTIELLMQRALSGSHSFEPKQALERYQAQMSQQLTKIVSLQTQLMQQTHNRLHLIKQLHLGVNQKAEAEPKLQKLSEDSVARRMMDLFNR